MIKYLPTHQLKKKAVTYSLITALTLGGVAGAIPVYQHVQAQENRVFTISPPTIQHEIKPGERVEGKMKIYNESSEPLVFDASIQDFIVDNDQGLPTILQEDVMSNNYSSASWIAIYPRTFTVNPQQRVEVTYYIQVPKGAMPGGRYAAVILKPQSSIDIKGTGTAVQTQIGNLFYITVAGPVNERAKVTKFDANRFVENGPIDITTNIQNNGPLHIRPKGFITVKNMLGRQSYTVPLTETNIFPERAREITTTFGKKFMLGRYEATLNATYGKNNNLPLTATIAFWVFPWKIAVIVILIIVAAILGGMYASKKKKGTKKVNTENSENKTESTPNSKEV